MHFTLWRSRIATEGSHAEIAWSDFVAFVSTPTIAENKESLEGWSPIKARENRRGKAHVEAVSCLVLDDDANGLTLDGMIALYHGAAGVVHSSHSYTQERPKWRVVLRLSRDVSAEEYEILWSHVCKRITDGGYRLDEQTKDASRLWFVPACREAAAYEWRELAGQALDVDALLGAARANEPEPEPEAPEPRPQPADARRKALAAALGAAWPAKGRHAAQLALAGALRAEGWSSDDALEFLCDVCRAMGNEDRPKRKATIDHTWAQTGPVTGWTRLKDYVDPVIVDAARSGLSRDAEWTEKTARRLAEVAAQMAPPATAALKLPPCDTVTLGPLTFEIGGYDAELPPINYQIDGLIARGDVAMFVAHGNSLKTWLGLSIAASVASGRPWLGRYMTTRGKAAIVDFESGRYEVLRRLKVLGVKSSEVEDRLLRTSYPAAQFVDPETWIGLAGHGLDFMLVDSFNAAAPDLDENDARAAIMLQHAGRFAEATSCTVVFVHHSRKGSGGDRREAVRGSTAIFAACDRIFEFADLEKKEGGAVLSTMQSVKDGAGRTPADVRVELTDQGLRWVEIAPPPPEDKEPTPERNRALVIATLQQHPAGLAKEHLINIMKGKRENKFELLSQMVLAGILVEYRDSAEKKTFIMLKPGVET